LLINCGFVWAQPYAISTVAGGAPPPTPVPGTSASVGYVNGVATDGAGNVYFNSWFGCVFKLDANRILTRFAGTCRRGFSGDGGAAISAQVTAGTIGLAADSAGNLYFVDGGRIRKVSAATGTISTIAGGGTLTTIGGDGGPAISATFALPDGLTIDAAGNLYITDLQTESVRKIFASDGVITTVAGNGSHGFSGDGGPATSAELNSPTGAAVDSAGNLYIADSGNYRIRKVSPTGIITTAAGNGTNGESGNGGAAASAELGAMNGLAIDASGNLYVVEQSFGDIRKISASGIISTIAGPATKPGLGDGGPATSAGFSNPVAAAIDSSGNLYIADSTNSRVRQISPAGIINTVAGNGTGFSGDGGPAISAQLFDPTGAAADAAGNFYVVDYLNERVRRVSPNGVITTVAGGGGFSGDGVPATSAQIGPYGVALDSAGNLYIGDSGNNRVRKVSASGIITTVAGNGTGGFSGDGGPATSAQLNYPEGVKVDAAGNLYIADVFNRRIRKVSPNGIITTVAGNGTAGYSGDGGPATSAELDRPTDVTTDSSGNLYISDEFSCVVREVDANGTISTYAGTGGCGHFGDGGKATSAALGFVAGLAFDTSGNLYFGDTVYIRKVSPSGIITTIAGNGAAGYSGDGGLATNASFGVIGVAVDPGGNVYLVDPGGNAVRKLTPDIPSGLSISGSGDNQTGQVGWTLPNPLQVVVNGSAGAPVPGVAVNFAVASGAATLSAASVVSDSTGTASVQLTLGANPGAVTVTATVAGFSPVQFNASAIAAPSGGGTACTISAPPSIASINSATDFGGFSNFAPGSWLEVKGSNLAVDTRLWTGSDFQGANAPTGLDTSSVSIGGNAGFVYYISGGQINVQAPADSATGSVNITVTTCAGTSAPFTGQQAAAAPGMLAPASFNIGGKQYLVALFQDGVTYVGNSGLIPGVPFRPAKPGDMITAYGIGFGPVTPAIAPGVVVSQSNNIPNLSISFGQTPAVLTYAGLAPNAVGLYQFNITVPQVANGDSQINVSVGGVPVQQTLYLTVQQ